MDHHHLYENEKMEPGEMLEDCWFFGNLLHKNSRLLRSLSDPCTTSLSPNNCTAKSYEEIYASINKLNDPALERQPRSSTRKGSRCNRKGSSSSGLNGAPSMPTSSQDYQDEEEIEFSMGNLIRQASMKNSDRLPPRGQPPAKALTPSPSFSSMQRSRRKGDAENIKSHKSLTEVEFRELQGFKDLGLDFSSSKVEDDDGGRSGRRPRPSEGRSSAPPVPKWNGKRSTEDMKAQIKFWARAVASNVRQEC